MPRRVLLTGARGMLGQALWAARPTSLEVVALGRDDLDIADRGAVRDAVARIRPEWIINAAAYTAVDRAETEESEATRVNGEAVGHLAEAATRCDAGVVHFGSDYVFDGRATSPYPEDADPNPLGAYGRSKLHGEVLLRSAGARFLLVRTQWLFGPGGKSFPLTMWQRARNGQPTRVVNDQFGSPTSTVDLARATWGLIGREGTIHVVNRGVASWFDVASHVFQWAGARHLLTPCQSADYPVLAPRPAYSALDTARFEQLTGGALPDWPIALSQFLDTLGSGNEAAERSS